MKKILQARLPILAAFCVFAFICFPTSSANAQPINNLCGGATTLISTPNTCAGATAGTLAAATYTAIPGVCSGGTRPDVWYTFVAASPNPTITITGNLTTNNPGIQLYTDCAGTLAPAPNCVSAATLSATSLTPGTTYFIRVFSTSGATPTFSICITDPNYDLCANAITLTPNTTCINVPGNFFGSSTSTTNYDLTKNSQCVPGSIQRDVWYKFVAQTTNPVITYTGVGAWAQTNVGIQIVSNNCGSNFTPFYCGSVSLGVATINADFLTPGTTYMIRVYSTTVAAPASALNAAFNICIDDPVEPAPSNDECTGAVTINVMNFCNSIPGDMGGATQSSTPLNGSCAGPNAYDVWYKFTAVNNTASIAINNPGSNFQNPHIELFSGNCGGLTSIGCGASPLTNSSLTAGSTYYIRVYSTTPPPPNGNARFDICITSNKIPQVRFGNSYVNMSKKTTGGVVQPGDTLEIRFFIQYSGGVTKTNARFLDNIPTKTSMLALPADSIRIITNEGQTYKRYTPLGGDDPGTYKASPAANEFNIRVNIGFASNPGTPANNTGTETASATGTMAKNNKPTLFGSSLIFAVAYRVKVTGAVGDTIVLNPAQFRYMTGGANDTTLTATSYKILITSPLSLCTNSIGLNNAAEFGGTFGSGTTPNRPTDLNTPIAGYSFVNDINAYNSLGDGRYAVVKNISPRNRTAKNANFARGCPVLPYGDPLHCNNRMHGGHWYIDGDHTGTTNATGNLPPAINASAGYMLEVNADYVPSEIYSQTLNNLCPNTYYEFSAWFRNICPTCGADSTGAQFVAGSPTAPANGYPGVLPNLSFALDGLDYYSTGGIDTIGWVKKGFVFRTGTTQTSATFSIRNNSQGGGGNDWVMDDIAVATCLPTMSYSPTINPNICRNNPITIADTISSFFKNYTTYKWQRSTDGGANWFDITGVTTLADTNYYITTYTIPPTNTNMTNNGDLYRVVVATTAANLTDPDCNISDGVTITLSVTDCGIPLKSDLLSFNGHLVVDKSHLSWTTSKEDAPIKFNVERSTNGTAFTLAGSLNSHNDYSAEVNSYDFIDPQPVSGKVYYRLVMIDRSGVRKYSRIIQLNKQDGEAFGLVNVINPFNYTLDFDVSSPVETKIDVMLIDLFGKVVQKNSFLVHAGVNALSLPNTESLPAGTYIFRVKNNETIISRKVLKKNL